MGDWWWQINQKDSQSYKKELKLAFGIDMIIDHVIASSYLLHENHHKNQQSPVRVREVHVCEVQELSLREKNVIRYNFCPV